MLLWIITDTQSVTFPGLHVHVSPNMKGRVCQAVFWHSYVCVLSGDSVLGRSLQPYELQPIPVPWNLRHESLLPGSNLILIWLYLRPWPPCLPVTWALRKWGCHHTMTIAGMAAFLLPLGGLSCCSDTPGVTLSDLVLFMMNPWFSLVDHCCCYPAFFNLPTMEDLPLKLKLLHPCPRAYHALGSVNSFWWRYLLYKHWGISA